MTMKRILVIPVLLCSCMGSEDIALETIAKHKFIKLGNITSSAIRESSGLINSISAPNIIWTHNDSGDGPFLYAMNLAGSVLGQVRIRNAINRDWEDATRIYINGIHYLLIADIGDNDGQRRLYQLYIIKEPKLSQLIQGRIVNFDLEYVIRFRYEDGPRDSEAIAVDPRDNTILIASKRDKPAKVYALRWHRSMKSVLVAKKLTTFTTLPKKKSIFSPFKHQITAMDISPDGSKLVILTYGSAYLYVKTGSWGETLINLPKQIPIPKLRQAEGIAFSTRESAIYISSEGRRAPIIKIQY